MLLSRKEELKTKMKKTSNAYSRITASCKRGGTVGGVAVNDRRKGWSHEKSNDSVLVASHIGVGAASAENQSCQS
jgi:hypothetical protein